MPFVGKRGVKINMYDKASYETCEAVAASSLHSHHVIVGRWKER